MTREVLSSTLGLLLVFGGCPKRQTTSRIVYVPSPPAAQPSGTSEPGDTIVISEPAPPQEPVMAQPQEEEEAPPPKPERRRRRAVRAEPAGTSTEPTETPDATEPAAIDVSPPPPLETRDGPEIRSEVLTLQADIQKRVEEMSRRELSREDQKTFEDAKQFLEQSGRALEQGDLQRALMLAKKASLLISALQR